MRTTVNLDDDVVAEVERLRREEGRGLSEAVNMLARAGLPTAHEQRRPFRQITASLGLGMSVDNVVDALVLLDQSHRLPGR
jgi:hypothetical protein